MFLPYKVSEQGSQPYWASPFSKTSLVIHSRMSGALEKCFYTLEPQLCINEEKSWQRRQENLETGNPAGVPHPGTGQAEKNPDRRLGSTEIAILLERRVRNERFGSGKTGRPDQRFARAAPRSGKSNPGVDLVGRPSPSWERLLRGPNGLGGRFWPAGGSPATARPAYFAESDHVRLHRGVVVAAPGGDNLHQLERSRDRFSRRRPTRDLGPRESHQRWGKRISFSRQICERLQVSPSAHVSSLNLTTFCFWDLV